MSATSRTPDSVKAVKKVFPVPGSEEESTVTLRRLRSIDKIEVGIQQSALLRGLPAASLNNEAQEYSYILATMSVALVEPEDFSFTELDEVDLLEIWKEWDDWTRSFRKSRTTRVGSESGQGA